MLNFNLQLSYLLWAKANNLSWKRDSYHAKVLKK